MMLLAGPLTVVLWALLCVLYFWCYRWAFGALFVRRLGVHITCLTVGVWFLLGLLLFLLTVHLVAPLVPYLVRLLL